MGVGGGLDIAIVTKEAWGKAMYVPDPELGKPTLEVTVISVTPSG